MRAEEVVLSPDLATVAFTSWEEGAQNYLLYTCEQGATRALLVGERTGYHAQPSFSLDGSWIFFSHHPRKGGPPGWHEPGANAQLYRVRADGSELEALTGSPGCKLSPRQVGTDLVLLVHATCEGPRTIEILRLSDKRVTLTAAEGAVSHYPDIYAPDQRLLFTEQKYGGAELVEIDLRTKRKRLLWELPEGYEQTRARWSWDGKAVFFQQGDTIWRLDRGRRPTVRLIARVGDIK